MPLLFMTVVHRALIQMLLVCGVLYPHEEADIEPWLSNIDLLTDLV